jgi:hypothetical protein
MPETTVGEWHDLYAGFIGFAGSMAYFTAVYFGFVGQSLDSRTHILTHFQGQNGIHLLKPIWYAVFGGVIATVFQLLQSEFVPVQSLILGATWPSVVAQFLSGRQTGPSDDEAKRAAEAKARELGISQLDELKLGVEAERNRVIAEATEALGAGP